MVKSNYFLSGRKTEHDAFRTGIKTGSCVKYEGTFRAITSSLSWVCEERQRRKEKEQVGSWRRLRV